MAAPSETRRYKVGRQPTATEERESKEHEEPSSSQATSEEEAERSATLARNQRVGTGSSGPAGHEGGQTAQSEP